VCIKRDLEVLCLLEVQVSVLEGSWRRFWSLGGVLKNFGGHLEFGGAQRLDWCSLEVFQSIGCACVHIPAL
jgi:hypothetical protein